VGERNNTRLRSDKTLKIARSLYHNPSELTNDQKSEIRKLHHDKRDGYEIRDIVGFSFMRIDGFKRKVKREIGIDLRAPGRIAHRGEKTAVSYSGSDYSDGRIYKPKQVIIKYKQERSYWWTISFKKNKIRAAKKIEDKI
jgi:hypothetical protein